MINAYGEIRKVPLDFQGIKSSAYAVQRRDTDKEGGLTWKECGVVGSNYLLVPNEEVRDMALEIATKSKLDWSAMKTFFDGKRYIHFMQSKTNTTEIAEGDDVALGMGFWNSYDGSTALQFRTFLVRLLCTNGMITKDFMNLMRFKHNKTSEGYEDEIINAAKIVDNCGNDVHEVTSRMRKMVETPINLNELATLRNPYLDFFNACTDILWHEKKPTMASFEHNQKITDNLLQIFA